MLLAGTAMAAPTVDKPAADLTAYVQARVAQSVGEGDKAAKDYQTALASAPDNAIIAEGAFDQALAAGDLPLAVNAARIIDRAGESGREVILTLVVQSVLDKDWTEVEKRIVVMNSDDALGFIAPILGAWAAVGTKRDDPLALLDKLEPKSLGYLYGQEHRPLLLLAQGKTPEGIDSLRERIADRDARSDRLKLAGAAWLAKKGKKADAIALLDGRSSILANARARLEKRGKLKSEIATPAQGMAELFLRLALDLERQDQSDRALVFARLATFLNPDQSEPWLITSALLSGLDREQDALVALAHVPADDLAGGVAADLRIRLLAASGREDAALQQAYSAAMASGARPDDWERLGDLYIQLGREKDAADAYGQALEARDGATSSDPEWRLLLSKAGALDQAGNWPQAKATLESAYRLAPREPLILNYLGYAQLVRRENLEQAEQMIRQARRFNPDSGQILDSLGWARYLRGDAREAIQLLERAIVTEPNDPTINEHLGDAYYSVGRRYEARYAWRAALVTADEKDAGRLRTKVDDGYRADLASP
jgi:tetratricopeptide (TPR) repeat protein